LNHHNKKRELQIIRAFCYYTSSYEAPLIKVMSPIEIGHISLPNLAISTCLDFYKIFAP